MKKQAITSENKPKRDKRGRLLPNNTANLNGRPKETPEKKELNKVKREIKKVQKELIDNYRQKLAEALPRISPVLIAKALSGDIQAIKEVHDRVMGRPSEDISLKAEIKTENILTEEQLKELENEVFLRRTKEDGAIG
jgi:hypothetical protein